MAGKASITPRAAIVGALLAITAVTPVSAACLTLPDLPASCHSKALGTAAKFADCGLTPFAFVIYADPFGGYQGVKNKLADLPKGADLRFYYTPDTMERRWGNAPDNQFGRHQGVAYYRVIKKAPHGERWVRTPICN